MPSRRRTARKTALNAKQKLEIRQHVWMLHRRVDLLKACLGHLLGLVDRVIPATAREHGWTWADLSVLSEIRVNANGYVVASDFVGRWLGFIKGRYKP